MLIARGARRRHRGAVSVRRCDARLGPDRDLGSRRADAVARAAAARRSALGRGARWRRASTAACSASACTSSIHAMCGDPTAPNWGTPVGLPYGVPEAIPPTEEAAYLHPFNQHEARAWVGLARGRVPRCSRSSGRCCLRATSARTASPAATRSSTCPRLSPRAALRSSAAHAALSRARAQARGRSARVVHRRRSSTRSRRSSRRPRRSGARSDRARYPSPSEMARISPEEAGPQRSVHVRLDAQVEAVLRRAAWPINSNEVGVACVPSLSRSRGRSCSLVCVQCARISTEGDIMRTVQISALCVLRGGVFGGRAGRS